jgi:hypothetical protein
MQYVVHLEKREVLIKFLFDYIKGRARFGNLGVDMRILLKRI